MRHTASDDQHKDSDSRTRSPCGGGWSLPGNCPRSRKATSPKAVALLWLEGSRQGAPDGQALCLTAPQSSSFLSQVLLSLLPWVQV